MYHDVMVVVLAFLTLFRWPGFLAVVGVIYHCLDARIACTNVVVDDKILIFFPRGIEVSDAEALVTMSMIISESKNAPLLLFSGVDVRDFTATLVLTG